MSEDKVKKNMRLAIEQVFFNLNLIRYLIFFSFIGRRSFFSSRSTDRLCDL